MTQQSPTSGLRELAPDMVRLNVVFLGVSVVVMAAVCGIFGWAMAGGASDDLLIRLLGLGIGAVVGGGLMVLIFSSWLRPYRRVTVDLGAGVIHGLAGDLPLREIDKAMVMPAQHRLTGTYGADVMLGSGDKEVARIYINGTRLRKLPRANGEVLADVLRRSSAPTAPDTIEGLIKVKIIEPPSWHSYPPEGSPGLAARNILVSSMVPAPPRKGIARVASNIGLPADVVADTIRAEPQALDAFCAALERAGISLALLAHTPGEPAPATRGKQGESTLPPEVQVEVVRTLAVLTGNAGAPVTATDAPAYAARLAAIVNPVGMAEAVSALKQLEPDARAKVLAEDVGMKGIWDARNDRP